jgi:hypothetical protein
MIAPDRYMVRGLIQKYILVKPEFKDNPCIRAYARHYLQMLLPGDQGSHSSASELIQERLNIENAWQVALQLGEYDLLNRVSSPFISYLKQLGRLAEAYQLLKQSKQQLSAIPERGVHLQSALSTILVEISRLEKKFEQVDLGT